MTKLDMSQYLDVFLDEAREQLALLETNILQMERGDHTAETLQVIFRAAHTLKGSSRVMDFGSVGDLTHEMENVLDDLRQEKLAVSTPIINALLRCLDALTALIDAVAVTGADTPTTDQDIPALVAHLSALRLGVEADTAAFPISDYEQASLRDALAAGLAVFQIKITLHADCLMKSVRVFMALGALEPLGSVLAADPNEERLEAEEFDQAFRLLFASEHSQKEVEKALSAISEVESVTVARWKDIPDVVIPCVEACLPEAAPAAKALPAHTQTIRVDVGRLDSLLNLIGELVIDRTQIARIGSDLQGRYPRDERVGHLVEATHRVARVTAELQDEIMQTRMLPIDGVFQRMPRMVRDLAQKTGKDVDFRCQAAKPRLTARCWKPWGTR